MKRFTLAAAAILLASTMAQAAVDVTVYRLQAGRYIRILWADTAAELPTTNVTEGAMAWDKATDTLLCWDSAAWVGCSSGGSGAPTSAEYIVAALHAGLSAERVGTDTTEIDWDFGTAGQAKLNLIDGSIEVSRLKTSDTPADGECIVYEATGDEVAFNACGGAGVSDGDKGDITVSGSGATWTVDADAVALGTDTTGNYVSSATSGEGLALTGTEGASLGLKDCAAAEALRRNVGDTDWECFTPGAGVSDHGALSGLADDDHSQYTLLAGRAGGQTLSGGTAGTDTFTLYANAAATSEACLFLSSANSYVMRGSCDLSVNSANFGLGTTAAILQTASGTPFTVIDNLGDEKFRFLPQTGAATTEGIFGIGSDTTDLATQSCLDTDSDRFYGDKDCDGTKDVGEEYLDNAAGSGSAITLDLGDDGGNDSTALAEIATVNDSGGAFTEPSADKLQIDVAKLRPASWANPPASPHSSDDEFNDGNTTGWTIGSGGTANPATSGTIDYTASLTTPIIDASTIPGWVALQSDQTASAAGQFYIYKTVTLSTDNTFFTRVSPQARVVSAANEGNAGIWLANSGDGNEAVSIRVQTPGTGWRCEGFVQNNGVFASVSQIANSENQTFFGSVYLVIWKKSNVYHLACAAGDGGAFQYIGAVTKTGVTTFDTVRLYMDTMNETPSFIAAFDFFRMKDSLDYSLVNP